MAKIAVLIKLHKPYPPANKIIATIFNYLHFNSNNFFSIFNHKFFLGTYGQVMSLCDQVFTKNLAIGCIDRCSLPLLRD
ncbi:hypothetical protein BpHYR1_035374 [Brachionus plicatilis]|uniref:Uncharacterized protein n=1 Tax=Brachionus plicatilis TaxID=10195 RepID=A0A3M7P4R0_BRAPC|nr:hypothetical protein BpHYR1_035374 [Brachionus plicatilis]